MTMRRRRIGERGAAAVEFAIVLPVLLLVLVGMIDWGRYFFLEHVVVNCARESARAGSVATSDILQARAQAVLDTCLRAGALDPSRVSTAKVEATADSVVVTLGYPAGSLSGLGIPVPGVATARAEMRR